MTLYQFYKLDLRGHIKGLPDPVECSDDDDAVEKAKARAKNCVIEIWDLQRRVAVIAAQEIKQRNGNERRSRELGCIDGTRRTNPRVGPSEAPRVCAGLWFREATGEASYMCKRCDEIDAKIARYRRLANGLTDVQMLERLMAFVIELDAEKLALHSNDK